MKKVVQILEAATGGTRRHLSDLAPGLDRRRFDVSLVVSLNRNDPEFLEDIARFRQAGIAVYTVSMKREISPFSDILALFKVRRILRRIAPDIVHAHSSKAGIIGRAAAWSLGVPRVVYTPHGYAFDMWVNGFRRFVYRSVEKLAARWTDAYVCVCRSEYNQTRRLGVGSGKCQVVYNGVRLKTPVSEPKAMPVQREVVIGCIGRLCPQKGQDVLADAADTILRAGPGTHLLIVGSGPLRERLEDRLGEWMDEGRIHLPREASEREVDRILDELDIYLLPSRWEGLPYGLLDAMGRGLPVVASRVGGIPEMIRDGVEGLLVPAGDPEALGRAVLRCVSDSGLRRKLGEAARRRVEPMTVAAMIHGIEQVYSQDLDESLPDA